MRLSLWTPVLVAMATTYSWGQELSYKDSINALAYGNVAISGNSSGTIWLNITGFSPAQLPHVQRDTGMQTLDNLQSLAVIAGLAKTAATKGQWGDIVFLHNAFAMNAHADYIQVSSDQMKYGLLEAVSGNASTPDAALIDLYASTSSSPYLAAAFQAIKTDTTAAATLEKRWFKEACDSAHQAARSACTALIQSISVSATVKTGGPRNICQGGCCISWSSNATFQLQNLTNAASYCVSLCTSAKLSCEVWGVSLNGTIVDQCLSNRADGCT